MKIYTCSLCGGFGNQLFKIFYLIGLALEHNCYYLIDMGNVPIVKDICGKDRYNCRRILLNLLPELKLQNFETRNIDDEIVELHGYLQVVPNEDIFQEICNITGIRKYQEIIRKKHSKILENNTVAIHLRHGDFSKLQYDLCMKENYYIKCIDNLIDLYPDNKFTFLIFYEYKEDSVDRIIKILQEKYTDLYFLIIENNLPDEEQLILQSLCNHNIIANSTYSLFAALFNPNTNRDAIFFAPHQLPNFSINHMLKKSNIDARNIICHYN